MILSIFVQVLADVMFFLAGALTVCELHDRGIMNSDNCKKNAEEKQHRGSKWSE